MTTVSIYDMHEEQYTLAQFARRVGISEGRARAMLAAGDRLPRPDVSDADGRPMWRQSTIDRWCRRVGRPVPKDAKGVASWQDASEPAPVMFCGRSWSGRGPDVRFVCTSSSGIPRMVTWSRSPDSILSGWIINRCHRCGSGLGASFLVRCSDHLPSHRNVRRRQLRSLQR